VSGPGGEQLALRNVVSSLPTRGPIVIERKDQQRLATVTANIANRDLGSVAGDVSNLLAEIRSGLVYTLVHEDRTGANSRRSSKSPQIPS
jgi:HAE1 family hydrophobic/amphiphilic exporter-1